MQLHGSTHKGVLSCASHILKHEGFSAFYVSYPTTLAMTVPFQMIHFISYEYLSKVLNPNKQYDPKSHIIAGGLAGSSLRVVLFILKKWYIIFKLGAAAAAATTPLDVVKTVLQTRGAGSDSSVRNAQGIRDVCNIILKRYGWRGFLMGISPRVFSHMPSTAICWTTYETLKHFLNRPSTPSLLLQGQ